MDKYHSGNYERDFTFGRSAAEIPVIMKARRDMKRLLL